MSEERKENDDVPKEFRDVFASLVKALQPRYLEQDAVRRYWRVLQGLPIASIQQSAAELERQRFWPNTGDWFEAANIYTRYQPPVAGSRHLEELDGLHANDSERDEICKGLSDEDGDRLMARYGYVKDGRNWRHTDDLT